LEKDDNDKWVDKRLDQIQKYRNLKECMFGAEVILEVVETFELKGNFKQIRDIQMVNFLFFCLFRVIPLSSHNFVNSRPLLHSLISGNISISS
jgi:hypothetical protein